MRLVALVERLQRLETNSSPREIACIAMLLCDDDPSLNCLASDVELSSAVETIKLRMQAADDQHAAVARELDSLASTEPCEFDPQHIWLLLRAIRVQSQLVDLYTGANCHATAP